MKKNFLTLILTALLPLWASAVVITVKVDDICYKKDTSTKTGLVTTGVTMWDYYYTGDVVVPETFSSAGTYTVTGVEKEAFYMSTPTSVTLPETVESLGQEAFYGVSTLKDFTVPNSVKTIAKGCFQSSGLESVTIGSGITEIAANAFAGCSALTDVYILAETPPYVYGSTFQGVKANATLHVPKGKISAYRDDATSQWTGFKAYVEIGETVPVDVKIDGIYYRLSPDNNTAMVLAAYKLQENGTRVNYTGDVTIPETVTYDDKTYTVTSLEAECFYMCTPTSIKLPETLLTIGLESFWEIKTMESLVIPNSVKTIDRGNFQYFGIKTLTLGSGLESMGIYCFNQNTNLTDIYSLATVPPTLDANTFCSAAEKATWTLHVPYGYADTYRNAPYWDGFKEYVEIPWETLDVKIGNLYYRLYNDAGTAMVRAAMKFTENGSTVDYTGDVVVPQTVTYEGKDFTVTALENNCFQNCTPTSLTLPETLLTLGNSTFCNIKTLDELVIPNSVEKIDVADFMNLSVRKLTLGSGVKNLDYQCFSGNTNLTDLYVLAEIPPTCTYTTFANPTEKAGMTLHVPQGTRAAYREAMYWDGFKDYVEILPPPTMPETITVSPAETKTLVGETVTLTATVLPEDTSDKSVTWTSLDTSIATVDTDGTVTLIAPGKVIIQAACAADPSIKATATIEAFNMIAEVDGITYNITSLTDLTATATGLAADNANAKQAIIAATIEVDGATYKVTDIAAHAFAGTKLETVEIGANVATIGEEAFADCKLLVAVELPDNLKSIAAKAFYGSPALRYMRCVNTTPPTFPTSETDSNYYGEAFSTDIWPDCMLVIPANMFANYKKCAGWKNFRSWYYWHDYDVMPETFDFAESTFTGEENSQLVTNFTFSPTTTTFKEVILSIQDPGIATITKVNIPGGGYYYQLNLLKEGTTTLTAYCATHKAQSTLTVTPFSGIDAIEGDGNDSVRYFNLQGIEIAQPANGQPVIVVRGDKVTKEIFK